MRQGLDPFVSMVPLTSRLASSFMTDLMEPMFAPTLRSNDMFSMPMSEVLNQEEQYVIRIRTAGFVKENVRTDIKNDNIVIRAERMTRSIPYNGQMGSDMAQGQGYAWAMSASFERSYVIFEEADRQKISASMKEGLLTLVLPKKGAVEPAIETTSIPIA
eukprot:Plantae.Rhodophyta-Purpureofilum_apyrenoidigerum.ctg42319.p1 GENE.Plantae.Rhodophyta-Purpureofilum_apyrenoidigerum.ctg42319~~Plantae.Rhodophyta-Purpureofilum_apyrenoidigerum.ctg42319.p1  ORF type:complete len:160 (+),score=25.40 Plantae.Rhodophyta-Purpureofilum_apyrenoidigerum.ctg42319:128-607(+)